MFESSVLVCLLLIVLSHWLGWKLLPLLFALVGSGLAIVAYINTQDSNGGQYLIAKLLLLVASLWGTSFVVNAYRQSQQLVEENSARFRALFNTAVDGMIVIDELGLVKDYNLACEKLFGYRAQEVIGQNVKMLMPSPYRELHDGYLKRYRETKEARIIGIGREVEGRRKDGTTFPMELSVGETIQSEKQIFVGVIRDVTARKKAEADLQSAKTEAESANQAKSLFLANMSHEIRTPMNAVLGYAQLLENDPLLSSTQRRAIVAIENAGNHLLELIDDILNISKIEAGAEHLETEDFLLPTMIERISDIFSVRCDQKQLLWQVNTQITTLSVHSDQRKLRQILINLLSNAIKFTDRGAVTLSIVQSGCRYRFEVVDTGAGIRQEMREKIFEPFQQADGGMAKGGSGLGLAIVKRYIGLLGGELNLESQFGQGSHFFFTLELPPANQQVSHAAENGERVMGLAPGYRLTALAVDDVEDNREILAGMLRMMGVEVTAATNGEEALNSLHQFVPDVIFMDVHMPIMNGMEAIRHIRREWPDKNILCIAVSASGIVYQKQRYLDAGFDDFIMKPFRINQLIELMKRHLQVEFDKSPRLATPNVRSIPDFTGLVLPEKVLERLRRAVERNALTDIEDLLVELKILDPNAHEFATYMQGFLDQYDRKGLIKALELITHGKQGFLRGESPDCR